MQFTCVVTASYTLGFLKTKNPWLVFRLEYEISKQICFLFSFMEKMLIIQFHSMEKMLIIKFHSMEKKFIIQFHIWKNCLFCYFHTYTFTLWNCMKDYGKHFFHIWKMYDNHFLSTRGDLLKNCPPPPPYGIYLRIATPINKSCKFAAFWLRSKMRYFNLHNNCPTFLKGIWGSLSRS